MTTLVETRMEDVDQQAIPHTGPVAEKLNALLADGIVFYQKLRHYHWNVRGNNFFVLHEKFEELYNQWNAWNDDIAERLMTIGTTPVGTLESALLRATIAEDPNTPSQEEMVHNILDDLYRMLKDVKAVTRSAAEIDDRATENLMDEIAQKTEKNTWMLRAVLA